MTQAVHLDHHPFVFWNWTCLRLELISTSWGLTNHFSNIIFCATLQYHHGVAQQLQDLGGLSWFGPALAAVTSDVAGWSWWGERRVLIVEQRGFVCICLQVDCQGCLFRYFDSETLVIKKWDLSLRFWDDWSRCSQKLAEFATSINVFRVFLLFTHGRRTIISRYLLSYY